MQSLKGVGWNRFVVFFEVTSLLEGETTADNMNVYRTHNLNVFAVKEIAELLA